MRRHTLGATLVLAALAIAPIALAQTTAKPKKKGAKPAASATATAPAPDPTPDPAPPPPPPPPPTEAADTDAPAKKALPETPPEKTWDLSDTRQDPSKRYYFFGLRYRGDVIPQFVINAFVLGGSTIYSNAVGVELDSRKDGLSQVFALTLQNYNTGDLLFLQKDKPQTANNYSVVNSSLNAIYASVDFLWSVPLDTSHHLDFEYGLGVGLGIVFGDLHDDWVYGGVGGTGPYYDPATNQHFQQCKTVNDDPACQPANHSNATTNKVGNYSEQAGIVGPKPILFPMINFPQIGLRWEPVKTFEARLGMGFSLTGFWFGISGDYGLEQQDDTTLSKPKHKDRDKDKDKDKDRDKTDPDSDSEPKKDSGRPSTRGML